MKIDELITLLINFQKEYGRCEVQVNVPQLRVGDEGLVEIESVNYYKNDNICIIWVE